MKGRRERLAALIVVALFALLLVVLVLRARGEATPPAAELPPDAPAVDASSSPASPRASQAPASEAIASEAIASEALVAAEGGDEPPAAEDERVRVVVTAEGAPTAQPLELRRVGGAEVVAIAPDASGECRLRLAPGWWSVAVVGPFEELRAAWTARDPRHPLPPGMGAPVTFAPARAAVVLVPWGEEPGEAPELPHAETMASPERGELLHLDLRGPRLLTGVVRAGTGADAPPFAGATVDLELHPAEALPPPPPLQRVVTGADGRFRLVAPRRLVRDAGGDARLVARAPGHVPDGRGCGFDEDEDLDFDLRLTPGALTLAGRVVDAAGAPAPDTIVEASTSLGGAGPMALTGPDGRFRLEGIPPGSRGPGHAIVEVTARLGKARAVREGVVVGPGAPDVELVLARPATVVVRGGGGAAGALEGWRHLADGRPPVRVSPTWPELRLECGAGDWLELLVRSPGFAPRRVALRAPRAPVVVSLERAEHTLSGRVVHEDGSPAAGVTVRGRWGDWSLAGEQALERPPAGPDVEERDVVRLVAEAVSAPDGSFTLELPGPGPVALEAAVAADPPSTIVDAEGDVVPRQRHVGSRPPEAPADGPPVVLTLTAPWSCRVRLRLVAAESGARLASGRVQLTSARRAGEALEADLQRPGRHRFGVGAEGRVSRELEVDVVAGQPLDLGDVPLERAGALEVTLRWPDAPIARVELGRAGEGPAESFDLALGTFDEPLVAEGLVPGGASWVVSLRRPDGGRYEATFEAVVVGGETTRVEVDLRGAALLPAREDR